MNPRTFSPAWIVLFLALSVGLVGVRPLWEPDEGRYAEAAREMVVAGDWMIPRLQGEPHVTKPPLTYWLIGAGLVTLGVNEWGARAALGLAFFGTILLTGRLARLWGRSPLEARAGALVFGTGLLPYASGHILTTDMFLTFFITLGVTCAWEVWRGEGKTGPWRWGFWLAFGLAFLTKGPPGWLPLAAMAVFCGLRRPGSPRARLFSWPGIGAMLAVSISWYAAMAIRDFEYARYFVVEEVWNRIFTGEHERGRHVLFYFPVVALALAPWIVLWPPVVRDAWREMRAGWRKLADEKLFSLLWVGISFIVFTLANSKMYLYIIPLLVPMSVWFGVEAARLWTRRAELPRWARIGGAIFAGLWTCVLVAFSVWPANAPQSEATRGLARQMEEYGLDRIDVLYSLDSPPNTLSFHTGLLMQRVRTDEQVVGDYILYRQRDGSRRAVQMRRDELEEVTRGRNDWHIIAETRDRVVLGFESESE